MLEVRAMATRQDLRELAQLRLKEAEALFEAELFDGCAYLCGYAVELALKARVCATLGVDEYPLRMERLFKTHDFDDLKLLAGMEQEFLTGRPALLSNWSIASEWKPEQRYDAQGTCDRARAEKILNALRSKPDGVLECISLRW
jgi:hypothetical protein